MGDSVTLRCTGASRAAYHNAPGFSLQGIELTGRRRTKEK